MLRPTIPIVLETTDDSFTQFASHLDVELSFPGSTGIHCQSRGSFRQCRVTIQSFTYNDRQLYEDPSNWYNVTSMLIHNYDQHKYDLAGPKLVLRLKTSDTNGVGPQIYGNVTLHDVQINILDNETEWKGKRCSSYADPHQGTFDGYKYECQDTGCITGKTYIFYRNKEHFQEVQVRHGSCWGRPRCVCAVAARSGQDVFTIDACNGSQYINFPICNDNALKVIKETDKVYKIIFPTGTFVKVYLYNYGSSNWYINVEVYPTVSDFNRTSGLCGVLDNNRTNDLRRRDGTQDNIHSYSYYNPPDEFSLSWQLPVGSVEDLLSMSPTVFDQLTPLSTHFYKLCTCTDKKTHCSYEKYTLCETSIKGREYHCVLHSSSRKKRDLEFLTRLQENFDVKSEKVVRIRRQALNEVEANDICNEAFQRSAYYDTCLQMFPNFSNETLVNCINDLVMTGNHNLTQLHLDTALRQCQNYILLNDTAVNEHPDVTTVIVNLCPNNCSNRGVCSSGQCTCDYGFGGSDCSFDVLSPPTITRLSGDGVCDKSSELCEDITLYGHYFLENMGTSCYVTREEIDDKNTVTSQISYTVELQERTLYEGLCGLEYGSGSTFYTTFHFNLSNDGTQFSPLYTVYVYQSACQTFQNISGNIKVTLQSGYCFINGTCIQSGTFKSNDSCWQCLALSNAFDWTWDCTNTEATYMSTTISSPAPFSTSSSTIGPLSTSSPTSSISTSTTSSLTTSQSTIPLSGTLSQTTGSPLSMAPTTSATFSVQTTSSTTQESTTKNVGSQESVSTTKQPGTTSLNGIVTSATFSTTSTLPTTSTVKGMTSGTTKTLSNADDEATNKQTSQAEGLSAVAIGLIVAVVVVVAVIVAIAGYMIKQMKKNDDEHKPLDNSIEDNVNIYPDSNRTMANRGNFNPTDLLQFDSPADKFSRPPSATSTRMLPPHQDFRKMYDQSHLDKLFGAK
eukprot:XP_011432123.1 PREDICTED: von Willebrand factor D and EGF domain-containing protein [Crassostrea gigas]